MNFTRVTRQSATLKKNENGSHPLYRPERGGYIEHLVGLGVPESIAAKAYDCYWGGQGYEA